LPRFSAPKLVTNCHLSDFGQKEKFGATNESQLVLQKVYTEMEPKIRTYM